MLKLSKNKKHSIKKDQKKKKKKSSPSSPSSPSSSSSSLKRKSPYAGVEEEEEEEERFPDPEYEERWESMKREVAKLQNSLEGITAEPMDCKEYMSLYTTIYNLCTYKIAGSDKVQKRMYQEYKLMHESYCTSTLLSSLETKNHVVLLRDFVKRWADQKVMTRWLSHFFSYLDRFYVYKNRMPGLEEVGVNTFRELVFKKISLKIRDVVIGFIGEERKGEQIDRGLLKNVLDVFVSMGTSNHLTQYYESDFEEAMLEDTEAYYSRKASVWIVEDSCPAYMVKVEQCLKDEKERVHHYLHSKTEVKLTNKVEHELLTLYTNQLLEKEDTGCSALLKDDKKEDLSRMYRLFISLSGLKIVASIFKDHMTAEGTTLVKQAEDASSNRKPGRVDASAMPEHVFVQKVLQLHDKYLAYVNGCFADHTLFHKALKEAFEVFCNKNIAGSSSAEILAIFCDNILKKGGSEKLGDEAIEETIDKVVKVLAYISEKDLFAEFARKKLARRLLFDRTGNDEHERSLLMKMKQQFGAQFTSKMEGMLTDLTLAKEFHTKFESYLKINNSRPHKIDFAVTVLTTGFWPSYKSSDLRLPAEMVTSVENFKAFYETITKNRKLNWIYSLGTCNLTGNFESKTIELIVTTYQAATLLLFNNSDTLSYSEIKEQLSLTDDDIVRLLHSLSCAKYSILAKEPNTKTISTDDVFKFNYKFTDKMRRIKVPLPPVNEKTKVIEDVAKDRRHAIDASIVRIMKSRKVLDHQQLVVECVEQLSKIFKPDFKVIKKRIEDLITRDYLERDSENPSMYKYLS